jgi:hypothetical protein
MASSPVVAAFHSAVAVGLPDADSRPDRQPIGALPQERELGRALLLAHRAAVDWAGEAIAQARPETPDNLRQLGPLLHPEAGSEDLSPAARAVQRPALRSADMPIVELTAKVIDLGEALARIEEDASLQMNNADFEDVGRLAGEVLVLSHALRGEAGWAATMADAVLIDLINPGRRWH